VACEVLVKSIYCINKTSSHIPCIERLPDHSLWTFLLTAMFLNTVTLWGGGGFHEEWRSFIHQQKRKLWPPRTIECRRKILRYMVKWLDVMLPGAPCRERKNYFIFTVMKMSSMKVIPWGASTNFRSKIYYETDAVILITCCLPVFLAAREKYYSILPRISCPESL